MDFRQRTEEIFEDHLATTHQLSEAIADVLGMAAEYMLATLVNDGRILVCGSGTGVVSASVLDYALNSQSDLERPGLPSVNLSANPLMMAGLSRDINPYLQIARQIHTLGQPGDLMVAFAADGNCQTVFEAIYAARDREMQIIIIYGGSSGVLSQGLLPGELEICLPAPSPARILEIQVLVAHCLVDLVESALFGTEYT